MECSGTFDPNIYNNFECREFSRGSTSYKNSTLACADPEQFIETIKAHLSDVEKCIIEETVFRTGWGATNLL